MHMKHWFVFALAIVVSLAACDREAEVETVDTTSPVGTPIMETATPSTAGQVGWGAWNEWDTAGDNRLWKYDLGAPGLQRIEGYWMGLSKRSLQVA